MSDYLDSEIARFVWNSRYRQRSDEGRLDGDIEATWRRVADACAAIEDADASAWRADYYRALCDFRFLPGGRIFAGAGTGKQATLINCFVMGLIDDTLAGICRALEESAITMQQGGGIGCDFSTLRPRGMRAGKAGRIASGPVSFMQVWDAMCSTLTSTSARRGAMMATLRCDHPDILEFIEAKRERGRLGCFNLSVQVSDAFMAAVNAGQDWPLVFPADAVDGEGETVDRHWPGYDGPAACRVVKRVHAQELWESLTRSAYETGEPGVLFVDTVNRRNNLGYRERITTTNPCGEVPLPPYGACVLGSLNLTRFVRAPFSASATIDMGGIADTTRSAVRMLDAVIDISRYPLTRQAEMARGSRRVGLGITGLADALIMLGLHYDSDEARAQAAAVMKCVCHSAYAGSVDLAREKGAFAFLDTDAYLASGFVERLPPEIRDDIARSGIRNSHLLAVAPTGSISLLADNVSAGIEPVFDFEYRQRVRDHDGRGNNFDVEDYAVRRFRETRGEKTRSDCFVTARDLSPSAHIAMQAAVQRYVDNSISKTINIPQDYPFDAFKDVFRDAYEYGLKGCTVYRPHGEDVAPLQSLVQQECGTKC